MKYKVGDKVRKISGDYQMDGVVIGTMTTTRGKERYAVEHEPYGIIHIYNEGNLELREQEFKFGDDVEAIRYGDEWAKAKYLTFNTAYYHLVYFPDEKNAEWVNEVRAVNDTSR